MKKILFYKGPKSTKNPSKTYVLTSGSIFFGFLMTFSCRSVVELFLVGFRPILSNFEDFHDFHESKTLFFAHIAIPEAFWGYFTMPLIHPLWSITGLHKLNIDPFPSYHGKVFHDLAMLKNICILYI